MTVLTWDEPGSRVFQTGVDRGVLYLPDGTVKVWNGIVSVEESTNLQSDSSFMDGVKYLENITPNDYFGKLTAFTYPDEFDTVVGIAHVSPGLSYHDQPQKSFGLSYRTKVGNDIEGPDLGYRIHILYNLFAIPDTISFQTLGESSTEPSSFSWTLIGVPQMVDKVRPTVHISVDSRTTPPEILTLLENKLYGTADTPPSLPIITEVGEYFGFRGALIIIDLQDGRWMAVDESDTYINLVGDDPTHFQIDGVDAVYLDADTYEVSSTNVGLEP